MSTRATKFGPRLRIHLKGCDRKIKTRWSGVSCDCGARWFCA